jgi:hypothetical protein
VLRPNAGIRKDCADDKKIIGIGKKIMPEMNIMFQWRLWAAVRSIYPNTLAPFCVVCHENFSIRCNCRASLRNKDSL